MEFLWPVSLTVSLPVSTRFTFQHNSIFLINIMKKTTTSKFLTCNVKVKSKPNYPDGCHKIQAEKSIFKSNYSCILSINSPPFIQSNVQCRTRSIIRLCYILSSSKGLLTMETPKKISKVWNFRVLKK